jgi:hypothetical protein
MDYSIVTESYKSFASYGNPKLCLVCGLDRKQEMHQEKPPQLAKTNPSPVRSASPRRLFLLFNSFPTADSVLHVVSDRQR